MHTIQKEDDGIFIMESIKNLVEKIGLHAARTIVESQVTYPRTYILVDDKALITMEFEGSLATVITSVQNNIELRALDATNDVVSILRMMVDLKESILLANADMIIVYKGGLNILRLVNSGNPKSGRSINIEINSFRNELIRQIQFVPGRDIPWLELGIGFGVALLLALQF